VAVTLITPDTEEAKVMAGRAALEAAGYTCYRAAMGGPGLIVETL